MPFAEELLDGFPVLNLRTEGILRTCNQHADFLKDFAKVEKDYAKALQTLASSYKKELLKMNSSHKEVGYALS